MKGWEVGAHPALSAGSLQGSDPSGHNSTHVLHPSGLMWLPESRRHAIAFLFCQEIWAVATGVSDQHPVNLKSAVWAGSQLENYLPYNHVTPEFDPRAP